VGETTGFITLMTLNDLYDFNAPEHLDDFEEKRMQLFLADPQNSHKPSLNERLNAHTRS
jgi:hypothetical protein